MPDGPVPARQNLGQKFREVRKDDADIDTENKDGYRYSRKDDIDEDGYRYSRQIDRTDSLLGGFNSQETSELPLHEPTGVNGTNHFFSSSLTMRPNKLECFSSETLSSQVLEFEGKARANPIGVPFRCFLLG